MNVLFEEDGAFKAGSIMADQNTSFQVELPTGKRSKVKAANVLLRFATPAAGDLLANAEQEAASMDTQFLWETCGDGEFGFEEFAKDYFGATPSAVQSTALLIKLHAAPVWFHRKGRGRFRKAPAEILQAALAGLEKKRLQQEAMMRMAQQLESGSMPDELRALMPAALYQPDRNRIEIKALETACANTGLTPVRLLARAGAIGSAHDYHLGHFLFAHFAKGTGFPPAAPLAAPNDLPLADVQAFSIDDASTTEIDDAFSISPQAEGGWRIGIHIAAPGLGIAPESEVDAIARQRLSTVYFPGNKITMLPDDVVQQFTLAEGDARPAVSLYLNVAQDLRILNTESRIERVPVVANLRHHDIEPLFNDDTLNNDTVPEFAWREQLTLLWRFATVLEAGRGKPSAAQGLTDFNYQVDWQSEGMHGEPGQIEIVARKRGSPLDKLVAELMIFANATWGKALDTAKIPGIYRVQGGGRVRMTTTCGAHEGLGVEGYAWCTSPLRRYVDLVNQWQLLGMLQQQTPAFPARSDVLHSIVRDFDETYTAYADFQRHMERYWCLRWVQQNTAGSAAVFANDSGAESDTKLLPELPAFVVRESLLRLQAVPLFLRCPSVPALAPRSRINVQIDEIDLLDNEVRAHFTSERAAPTDEAELEGGLEGELEAELEAALHELAPAAEQTSEAVVSEANNPATDEPGADSAQQNA